MSDDKVNAFSWIEFHYKQYGLLYFHVLKFSFTFPFICFNHPSCISFLSVPNFSQQYTRASFVAPLCDDQLPHHDLTALHHAFGFSTERFDNLKYVEPDVLLYIAGNYLVKLDMSRTPPTRSYVMGVDGRGLGAFVVHPTLPLVVVGEKGYDPNIYVFEYPSWKVVSICSFPV